MSRAALLASSSASTSHDRLLLSSKEVEGSEHGTSACRAKIDSTTSKCVLPFFSPKTTIIAMICYVRHGAGKGMTKVVCDDGLVSLLDASFRNTMGLLFALLRRYEKPVCQKDLKKDYVRFFRF